MSKKCEVCSNEAQFVGPMDDILCEDCMYREIMENEELSEEDFETL